MGPLERGPWKETLGKSPPPPTVAGEASTRRGATSLDVPAARGRLPCTTLKHTSAPVGALGVVAFAVCEDIDEIVTLDESRPILVVWRDGADVHVVVFL
mmetsp:Transcript_16866/g.59874  ORF Transcript_16866/g.59874 Transcript_16866/m.59874 type:complete len:99 (-) Transcript_16866:287-583(-)